MKTDNGEENQPQAAALTLDDFLHGKFVPKGFNGSWASGKKVEQMKRNINSVAFD